MSVAPSHFMITTLSVIALGAAALGGPVAQAQEPSRPTVPPQAATHIEARVADALVQPRGYDNDPDYFFWYDTSESSSDCGGNPACDITFSSFSVSRDYPEDLVATVGTKGPTDPEMSNNDNGGVALYIDSDNDPSNWDYRLWSAYETFPLRTAISSRVERWDGDSWEWTDVRGSWYRTPELWLVSFPWQEFGIESAYLGLQAVDATRAEDWAPSRDGTPRIPIAALVAGAPGQPQSPRVAAGIGQVEISWTAPVITGASEIIGYEVTASPGGRTCTTQGLTCTVTELTPGTKYSFVVTATNAQGTGPGSDTVTATPTSPTPAAPTIKSKVVIKKTGNTASITTSWTSPAGATGFEIRWTLANGKWTPWKKTSATSATVTGIEWKTGRKFEVRAVNSFGAGPAAMRVLYYGPKEGR